MLQRGCWLIQWLDISALYWLLLRWGLCARGERVSLQCIGFRIKFWPMHRKPWAGEAGGSTCIKKYKKAALVLLRSLFIGNTLSVQCTCFSTLHFSTFSGALHAALQPNNGPEFWVLLHKIWRGCMHKSRSDPFLGRPTTLNPSPCHPPPSPLVWPARCKPVTHCLACTHRGTQECFISSHTGFCLHPYRQLSLDPMTCLWFGRITNYQYICSIGCENENCCWRPGQMISMMMSLKAPMIFSFAVKTCSRMGWMGAASGCEQ